MTLRLRSAAYVILAGALVVIGMLASRGVISASWLDAASQQTVPALIQLRTTLQRPNSPPPSLPWAVPVWVGFYAPGDASAPLYAWDGLWLDQNGVYRGVLGLAPGTYDVRLKNMHTLRNVKRNVTVTGNTTIDMGLLLEGDADGDNRVRASDFSLLRAAYFTNEGDSPFDPRCDFDEDNRIRSSDFALLRANYFLNGDIEVPAVSAAAAARPRAAAGVVALALAPANVRLAPGETFTVTLTAHAGAQTFATMDVDIRFPPEALQVVGPDGAAAAEIQPLPPATSIIMNTVNNGTGRILYAAGLEPAADPVSGDVPLARIRFKALRTTLAAEIRLVDATVADATGKWVTGPLSGARIQIIPPGVGIYLPLIMR